MSETKACQSTPAKDLEDRIMNPNIPKSESEWWAREQIAALKASLINYFTAAEFENVEEMVATKPPEFYRMMGKIVAERTKKLSTRTAEIERMKKENGRLREALKFAIRELEASGLCFDHPTIVKLADALKETHDERT